MLVSGFGGGNAGEDGGAASGTLAALVWRRWGVAAAVRLVDDWLLGCWQRSKVTGRWRGGPEWCPWRWPTESP